MAGKIDDGALIFTASEHARAMELFEEDMAVHSSLRHDPSLWAKGKVYAHERLNTEFLMYRHAYLHGLNFARMTGAKAMQQAKFEHLADKCETRLKLLEKACARAHQANATLYKALREAGINVRQLEEL